MLVTDIISATGLLAFTLFWTFRKLPLRAGLMWAALGTVLVSSVIGRWHGKLTLLLVGLFLLALLVRHFGRSETTWSVRPFSGFAFLLLSGFVLLPLFTFPVPVLPAPGGEHAVGVRDFLLIDESRKGQLEASDDEPRRLSVRVWYPAVPSNSAKPKAYASTAEAEKTIGYLSSMTGGPAELFSQTAFATTHSYEDAAVIDSAGLPVVFFSHGYTMYNWQNTVLMEELASQGYIVFSLAHAYDGGAVLLGDGGEIVSTADMMGAMSLTDGLPDYVQRELGGANWSIRHDAKMEGIHKAHQAADRLITKSAPVWLADRLFVSESLANRQVPSSVADLLDAADFSSVGHMGMSFGGSVSTAICYVDPRCGAVVNLDGGDFHQLGINADIPVPLLMLYQDSKYLEGMLPRGNARPEFGYNDLSYERYETAGSRQDIVRVDVANVAHLGFTDVGLYTGPPMASAMVGTLDAQLMNQIMNEFVVGFFDKHLRKQSNSFPTQQFADWEGYVSSHSVASVANWWNSLGADEQAGRLAAEKQAFELRDAGLAEVLRSKYDD